MLDNSNYEFSLHHTHNKRTHSEEQICNSNRRQHHQQNELHNIHENRVVRPRTHGVLWGDHTL
jgi:hypothetical protein